MTPNQIRYQRNKKQQLQNYQKKKHIWKETRRVYAESNFHKMLYALAKSRAKRSNIEFNIEPTDLVMPEICPYLNTPITKIRGKGIVLTNASIDRIDPSKGYIKGNVQIISKLANMMKSSATQEQLITFAKAILK